MPHPLPSLLDSGAAGPLRVALLDRLEAGEPLRLDGSEVTRIGQACLQVLASAAAAGRAAGIPFSIERPSAELADGCSLAGLPDLVA